MGVPDADELDRLFSIWKEALWKAQGISAREAEDQRELYRYRITGITRLDETSFEVHLEFAPNAVYGITHLPGSTVSIVIPLVNHGEVNAPPGMARTRPTVNAPAPEQLTPTPTARILNNAPRWSLPSGNQVVPSTWQATPVEADPTDGQPTYQ